MVAERDLPPKQWTSTASLASRIARCSTSLFVDESEAFDEVLDDGSAGVVGDVDLVVLELEMLFEAAGADKHGLDLLLLDELGVARSVHCAQEQVLQYKRHPQGQYIYLYKFVS